MKKSLIGLNAFNSNSKISNSNWENSSREATYIENGDTITLKASFVDSRNRITGNINIDQDTTIELSYMFYYINRGGTPNTSFVNDPKFPNRQQLPLEYFNNGTENANIFNPTTAITPSKPNGTSGIANLPITDPTEKTPENLAPLVESIVHPYSSNAISTWFNANGIMPSVNFSQIIVGESYEITSLGDISAELWNEAGATSAPYIGQIFKCIASPGSSPQFPVITADLAEVGKTYKIISLGVNNDTNWVSLNPILSTPSVNDVFVCLNPYPVSTGTVPTIMIIGTTYRITESNGYDFATFGGPSLPTNTNEPIDLNTEAQQGIWYIFTEITKLYTDDSFPIDYTAYTGTATQVVGDKFVSLVGAQNIPPIAIPTDKNGIYIVNIDMTIQVTNQGLINWDLLGYNSNIPTNNDVDIVDAEANTYYLIVNKGGSFGIFNTFPIVQIPNVNFENGNIINLPAPNAYTPTIIEFPVLDVTTLTPDYIGEYFIIIDNNVIDPALWATMFTATFGTGSPDDWDDGMIVQAQTIQDNPLPGWTAGVKIQWLPFMGIPIGSEIKVEPIGNGINYQLWETMGYTGDDNFITKAQVPISQLEVFLPIDGQLTGSFSFTKTGSVLRPYTLQVPFTFKTNATYPTQLETTDTTWVANVIPTDKVLQIQNYDFPITFTLTSAITTDTLNPTLTYEQIPSGTIQEDYDEADLILYDLEKMNHIRANNPVGFTNTIDVNNPDGLPYLLSYCAPKNTNGSTTFNTEILDPGEIKPFIKKWKMVLKKGSYTADYLAEIITRGMSIQRQKVQTTISGGSRFLGTPNASINNQMYKSDDFSYIRNKYTIPDDGNYLEYKQASCPYYGYVAPNCEQGGFPSENQSGSNIDQYGDEKMLNPNTFYQPFNLGKSYQPNLMFNPKNKNILPGYDGNQTTLPDTLPVNPKYTALDFNNPDSNIQDDTPFIYRPNAFTMRDINNPTQAKVRLAYNDYNLSNFNGIKPFGDVADENIKNIEMMYRPLVSDMDSSYFTTIQKENGLPVSKDYSIKPIISVPVAQLPVLGVNKINEGINQVACYSAPTSISTPVVGAPLMNLTYNQENNGLFEFGYMHTPVYAKLTAESQDIQECVGMYPNSITVITSPANNEILFNIENPPDVGTTDPTPWLKSGQIFIQERLSEITPTSVYGIPINNFNTDMNPFTLIYDNTKPNQYVSSTPIFDLVMFDNTNPNNTIVSLNIGDHVVIKGSLLKGIDSINDLIITILSIEGTYSISGTPSVLFYENIQQVNSVVQLAQQSGIIFYDMKATKADGTTTPFWENLGFNTNNMTYKADEPLTYEKFLSLTTKGFLGTSNVFDPESLSSGTTEQSYISYTDSLNMLGWYNQSQLGASYCNDGCTYNSIDNTLKTYYTAIYNELLNEVGDEDRAQMVAGEGFGVFTLQKKILYSLVETTIPLSATNTFSDNTDAGHYLICIEGYGGSYLLTDNNKLNVKSLVSTYYTGPNSFVSNSLADSALYEHIGSPMKIQNFKVRILNAFTGEEVENLGPNSSIYLEISKNLNKNNITNLTSSN